MSIEICEKVILRLALVNEHDNEYVRDVEPEDLEKLGYFKAEEPMAERTDEIYIPKVGEKVVVTGTSLQEDSRWLHTVGIVKNTRIVPDCNWLQCEFDTGTPISMVRVMPLSKVK